MRILLILAVLLLAVLLLACSPSESESNHSAYDLFQSLNSDQKSWYTQGALEMLVFDFATKKERARGQCAYDWFFEGSGVEDVMNAVDKNREYPLAYILTELVKSKCP